MSRTRKLQNKARVRASVLYEHDEKGRRVPGARRKGPSATEAKHGKRNRLPYDAMARKKLLRPRVT